MERVGTAVARGQPDRVPVLPHIREFAMRHCGLKFSDCLKDSNAYVRSQVECLRDFGYDGVWGMSFDDVTEALGATLVEYEDNVPAVAGHPVGAIQDVAALTAIDILQSRRIQFSLKLIRSLKVAVGKDVPVVAWTPAPLRTACMLRGIDSTYMDMIRNPALVSRLADACVQPSIDYATACAEEGADFIWVSNSVAGGTSVSRRFYEQFSVPYSTKVFSTLRARGIKTIYHFYGECSDRLDLVTAQGPDVLHGVDVDLVQVKGRYSDRFALMGNVKSVGTIYEGTPADVEKESIRCMAEAGKGGGYILSPGGAVPAATPPENLRAMVAVAKTYGVYPLTLSQR